MAKDHTENYPELGLRKPRKFNRLTMTSLAHHEQNGVPPTSVESRMSFYLRGQEEPYQRRRVAMTDWETIDLGWLQYEEVSCILIENLEDRDKSANQVNRSIQDYASKSIWLAFKSHESDYLMIPPSTFQLLFPSSPKELMLRAAEGEIVYRVHVFPA